MRQEKGRGHGPGYLNPPPSVCSVESYKLVREVLFLCLMPFSVKTKKETNKRYREVWKLPALSERKAKTSGPRQWEPCRLLSWWDSPRLL